MRCMTVSQTKGKWAMPTADIPREGTYVREIYDLFQSNKGLPVEFKQSLRNTAIIPQLTDFWGLDIRKVQQGSSRTGRPSKYVLAGEWFGRVYIDYIAERIGGAQ